MMRAVVLGLCLVVGVGCQDLALSLAQRVALHDALRPPPVATVIPGWPDPALRLYAGDLHFHVYPHDSDVHRGFDESVALLRSSGLDFVVVSPHVLSIRDRAVRRYTHRYLAWLQERMADVAPPHPLLLVGMEFTTSRYGHANVSFVDLAELLDETEGAALFAEAHRRGALIVANHPLWTPIPSFLDVLARSSPDILDYLSFDGSWRPFSGTRPPPYPAEIAALDEALDGYEAYNTVVAQTRDRFLRRDRLESVRAILARTDAEILRRRRRLVPVGGTDSHEPNFIRATTFIAAKELSMAGLREGLRRGRVCVRAPAPCALRVVADGVQRAGVGDAVRAKHRVDLRWPGRGELYLDGVARGDFDGGIRLSIPDGRCHLVRLVLEGGFSAPTYINCAFAEQAD
jgi:hypothetical protein